MRFIYILCIKYIQNQSVVRNDNMLEEKCREKEPENTRIVE